MSEGRRKTVKEMGFGSVEAGPDDPIYKRNWIIGSRNSTPLSRSTPKDDKETPDSKEQPAKK